MTINVTIDKVIDILERRLREKKVLVTPGSGRVVYSGMGSDIEASGIEFEMAETAL